MINANQNQRQTLQQIADSMRVTNYGQDWPPEYKYFYSLCGYFNRIYDTLYAEQDEWKRIARFAIDNQFLQIAGEIIKLNEVQELANLPCVGNGKMHYEPSDRVRVSFNTLRIHFQINIQQVCHSQKCQERLNNSLTTCIGYAWRNPPRNKLSLEYTKYMPFAATLFIIYQIRNNLFHGAKPEIFVPDYERNQHLIRLSARIVERLLEEISLLI